MADDRVDQLGYVGLEVSDVAQWVGFAGEVLGLEVLRDGNGADAVCRLDENHHRIGLHEGPRDDLVYAGWQVRDARQLDAVAARLRNHGAAVEVGTAVDVARRDVEGLVRAEDPNGLLHEVHWGPRMGSAPFRSPWELDGFVAEGLGVGHIVLGVDDMEANLGFFRDGLGLRISDYIDIDTGEPEPATVTFLHCGPRHHSLALAPFAQPKHLHHLMVQVRNPDDVGTTYDLCLDRGVPIASTLGRHTNDRMTSFYVVTPSGFQVEFGHGGVEIDDATWEVRTYQAASTWGHRSPTNVPARGTSIDPLAESVVLSQRGIVLSTSRQSLLGAGA